MKTISNINELRRELAAHRQKLGAENRGLGLVPTMGYLHAGHLSLVKRCKEDNDISVVSIFVNPTQFAPNEDLDKYPRDLEHDKSLLEAAGVDYLFCPSVSEMYPAGFSTSVRVSGVSEGYCGAGRPGHFDGVALVVSKLFNIVHANRAYFGLKDYQQYQVVRRMALDLNIDVEIIGMPIVREADGLAMSSRNVYLSAEERESALALSKSFKLMERLFAEGKSLEDVQAEAWRFIESHNGVRLAYLEFADPESLKPAVKTKGVICLLAARVGATRLIDNHFFNNE